VGKKKLFPDHPRAAWRLSSGGKGSRDNTEGLFHATVGFTHRPKKRERPIHAKSNETPLRKKKKKKPGKRKEKRPDFSLTKTIPCRGGGEGRISSMRGGFWKGSWTAKNPHIARQHQESNPVIRPWGTALPGKGPAKTHPEGKERIIKGGPPSRPCHDSKQGGKTGGIGQGSWHPLLARGGSRDAARLSEKGTLGRRRGNQGGGGGPIRVHMNGLLPHPRRAVSTTGGGEQHNCSKKRGGLKGSGNRGKTSNGLISANAKAKGLLILQRRSSGGEVGTTWTRFIKALPFTGRPRDLLNFPGNRFPARSHGKEDAKGPIIWSIPTKTSEEKRGRLSCTFTGRREEEEAFKTFLKREEDKGGTTGFSTRNPIGRV